ncbi:glycosyltransferase [Endozoicomonas gorgoniicola]|uniref:Glycosyltransferase n=1 Tax=Endozoicomonas gorgoniicola TaxID=1234144 RepID=A0ABT3MPT5_9GAMM|nr:glycosyltransferase [Endozoicomonas gorgoniicola]MCW7551377.1 glycosyltransferase [Endozoicomonas gorgoniicola]
MKVLHVSETLKGGIETYLSELIPLQTKKGYEVNLISQKNNIRGIRQYNFKNRGRLTNLVSLLILSLFFIIRERPDVVHIHSSFAGVIRPFVYLAKRLFFIKMRIIYCSHGWPFTISPNQAINFTYKVIERFLSFFCDCIICISSDEANQAIKLGINSNKLSVIHNGVSDSKAISDNSEENENILKLLFVGRFDRQKGIDVLLEAFEKSKRSDIQLNLVGDFVVSNSSLLKDGYKLNKKIKWYGWLDRNDIENIYYESTATVVSSRWEGFGLVAIESLRAGTPIICSAVGGLLDICQHGINGYQFNLSVDELTKVIDSLDKHALNIMGNAARQTYLSNFTAEKMFQKTDILYHPEPTFDLSSADASGTDLRS